MRKKLLITVVLALLITACAAAAPTEAPSIIMQRPTATPTPETSAPATSTPDLPLAGPLEKAARKQLAANLGLRESDVSVVSYEDVEFSNACLDVVLENVQCSQVMTPGRVIVLEAQDVQYKYHTNEDGSRVQPATLALIWKREGGIAGFCDTLTVFLSGEVFATKCKPQSEGKAGTFADLLSAEEQAQFNDWITTFAQTDLDASDPKGVADGMKITLKFFGTGSKPPTKSDQQALFSFAQNLYQKVAK